MKRILSLVLAVALLLGITSALADDPGFVDGKFTETRHITVEIFNRNNDGGSDPTNNVWTDFIKKGMLDNYNVEVEFKSVGRWTEHARHSAVCQHEGRIRRSRRHRPGSPGR